MTRTQEVILFVLATLALIVLICTRCPGEPARPGEIITMYATATYEDHLGVHEAYPAHASLVVVNPLQDQLAAHGVGPVYAPGAVRRWRASEWDEWHTWCDPCLPGIREVKIIGSRSVEGTSTLGGGLFVGAGEAVRPVVWPVPQPLPAITLLEEVMR